MEKRPIISTLRAMKPGDKETFPIEQQWTAINTYTNRMFREKKDGWKFGYATDIENGTTTITRVK